MTDDERKTLKPGDRAIVLMDDATERPFGVKYGTWQLGDGEWVVGLEGIAGGYLLRRVMRRDEAEGVL